MKKPGLGILLSIGKGKMKGPEVEEEEDSESLKLDAASELIQALKDEDAEAVAAAIEALVNYCQE